MVLVVSGVDGGVVQVIPVSSSLDKEGVSQMVFAAGWDYVGPVVVLFVVTNGVICVAVRMWSCFPL